MMSRMVFTISAVRAWQTGGPPSVLGPAGAAAQTKGGSVPRSAA